MQMQRYSKTGSATGVLLAGLLAAACDASAASYKCKDADGNWTEAACRGTPGVPAPKPSATTGARATSGVRTPDAAPATHAIKPPPDWDPSWTGAGPKPRIECNASCWGCADGKCSSLGDIFSMDSSREKAYERLVLGCDWRAREQWHKTSSELHFRPSDDIPVEPPGFRMDKDDPHVCIGGEGKHAK